MRPIGVLVLAAVSVTAQHEHHGGAVGYVPKEILEKPAALREGIGKIDERVSTKSAEAQAFYNQGVAYLHSYVWVEAARSFHQALRHDPNLAMAWIGLSRTYSGLEDAAAAKAAAEKAQTLADAGHANHWEKRRIAVRRKQMEALEALGNVSKHQEYKRALDDALSAYMNDAELWLLRGNAEEVNAAGRGQRGGAASVAFYEAALARAPGHFGAHHYLIHSYELLNRMPEALHHGEIYLRQAYNIPHAHHMFGHDLRRVGRMDEAIARFQKADDLERAYYAAEGFPPYIDWHHSHNLDLLSTAYQYKGEFTTAEKLMREAWEIPTVSEYAAFNKKEYPGFLLAMGRSDEALAAARQLIAGKWAAGRGAGHVMAGHALLAKKQAAAAAQELQAAEKVLADLGSGGMRNALAPYVEVLRGELLLRSGKQDEAREILKSVQKQIRAVPGPDAWSQALFRLEHIYKAAREAGDSELARFTAAQLREHDPNYKPQMYADER